MSQHQRDPRDVLRRSRRTSITIPAEVVTEVRGVLGWYFERVFGVHEGPNALPYYCAPAQVGAFAVSAKDLSRGSEAALFRLFVAMSMFQALRDVVIMRQQRAMPRPAVRNLASKDVVKRSIATNDCRVLLTVNAFDEGCNVSKDGAIVDCGWRPGASCHVKDATIAFNRMGDMGKLPTSAWLNVWQNGGIRGLLREVLDKEDVPSRRALLLVKRFEQIHRVGRKLASMFVSALSTPALAPGLTPWFPEVDGNELVVVDTNVARAVDQFQKSGASRTYDAREHWVREVSTQVDLSKFHPSVPCHSPRMVQQALYSFCSKSNRIARGDACATGREACVRCIPTLCPFAPSRKYS